MAGLGAFLLAGGSGGPPPLPPPAAARPGPAGEPCPYRPARQAQFAARAAGGSAHVLFTNRPDGVMASAARVDSYRKAIAAATAGTGVDPRTLEAIVFVESAGRPAAMVAGDPANAAGLTQILPQTGQALLGMHIDLGTSRRLTAAIDRAQALGQEGAALRLARSRAQADQRFDPGRALAATVRYLELARRLLGRADLAVVSYHMGIGNLRQVLDDYDSGRPVPYAQLYFDIAPDRHPAAYRLLAGFGDDSSLYYWRVQAAAEIMRLYRSDRGRLARLIALQTATDSGAQALEPPDRAPAFPDPDALQYAYARRTVVPLPSDPASLGLAYAPAMGSLAGRLGVSARLYRGLRPVALAALTELAARVRALSGGAAPLTVASTVADARYQQLLGVEDPPAAAGYSFTLLRRYVSGAQASALQATLDRLQALNLIAWERYPATIEVTVAPDAARVLAEGV